MRKNCPSDREKLLKFEAAGRKFAKTSKQFLETECFLTCSWRFLIASELDQLEFKLEKNIGIKKHTGKVRK